MMKRVGSILMFFISSILCFALLAVSKLFGSVALSWTLIFAFLWMPWTVVLVSVVITIVGGFIEYSYYNHKQIVAHIDRVFNKENKEDAENN